MHPSCGTLTRAAGIGFVIFSLAPNIVDYSMVASRNLECHVGRSAANALAVGFPFLTGWIFYFGVSFSDLVSAASPLLNGAVQFIVPAALFFCYLGMEQARESATRESTPRERAPGSALPVVPPQSALRSRAP